jgi:hypothetical protein
MYRSGDWLVKCDRCGMRRYASQCRFNWQNLFVCAATCWEERHPQDFVKAVSDDQSVPTARPTVPQTVGETTVRVSGTAGATTIDLTSVSGIADKDSVGIDDGTVHWTFSNGTLVGTVVTLGSYLPANAAAGNVVYLPSLNSETFTTATAITGADL